MISHRNGSTKKANVALASIIIPCWNQLEFTRICLDALFQHTGSAWELIVVDNGSTDGTAAFLAGLGDSCPVPLTVITNAENRGFPAAVNQGLDAATGQYLVLLNNDTAVTDGWLDGLIALTTTKADADRPPVGMVGPMSNYVTPPQVVEQVPYQGMEAMHGFARQWQAEHRGQWITTNKLSGFCLLMTRAVYEAVGGLDERFGLGFFDDDDLSLRVQKAGFGLVVAQDVFVHHFGNRTMVGNAVDAEALMDRNQLLFLAKWGPEAPRIVRGNVENPERRRKIIDAFIFYQELEMLEFRLKLLYPHVDHFVIVEADKTFSGLDKPFYYEQNKDRFAWASDKITYFKLRCDTSSLDLTTAPTEFQPSHDCWQIEYTQRNAIVTACKDLANDDLLIMGDVDEIPSVEAIEWAKQNVGQLPAVCQLHFFYYDLRHVREGGCLCSIFSLLRTARSVGTQALRNHRNVITRLDNAGWHLSYFGDADAIVRKIEAFSHQELNVPEFKDADYINRCRSGGDDLFQRGTRTARVAPEFFPAYFKASAPGHWWGADELAKEHTGMKAKVSLTMIVRNEEQNLPRCLESVRGLFDEIVVVDTGSTDRTKEIAAGFGARLVDFAWIDDFAAARNVALGHATGSYAFWLDADDVIEPPERQKLEALLRTLRPHGNDAYVVRCVCDTSDGGQLVVDQPRLFPRREGIRWERRIHEVINAALDRAGIKTIWTDIAVRHTGYADPVIHEQKRQRNLIPLYRELAERPDDLFVYYYLGTLAFERKQWQEALGFYLISQAKCGTKDAIGRKLFAMISWVYQMLGRYDEAVFIAAGGLRLYPNDGELWFRKAVALRYLLRVTDAEACWKRVLELGRPQTFYSIDPGIFGHLTRHNLALIAEERGDHAGAEPHWRAILAECPGHAEALRRLVPTAA
jgi:glycosyltransferase involved in cell wall biosynthesis